MGRTDRDALALSSSGFLSFLDVLERDEEVFRDSNCHFLFC